MTASFDAVILEIAQAARDLGALHEREAIMALVRANASALPGGPEWADRICRLIEQRGAVAEIVDVPA